MEKGIHRFKELFAQLGLPDEQGDITAFIATHAPLASEIPLVNAPFWTVSQARMLSEHLCADADWAAHIDALDVALRASQ